MPPAYASPAPCVKHLGSKALDLEKLSPVYSGNVYRILDTGYRKLQTREAEGARPSHGLRAMRRSLVLQERDAMFQQLLTPVPGGLFPSFVVANEAATYTSLSCSIRKQAAKSAAGAGVQLRADVVSTKAVGATAMVSSCGLRLVSEERGKRGRSSPCVLRCASSILECTCLLAASSRFAGAKSGR
jgi:hypothetical protein